MELSAGHFDHRARRAASFCGHRGRKPTLSVLKIIMLNMLSHEVLS